jgi:hypothetical protein
MAELMQLKEEIATLRENQSETDMSLQESGMKSEGANVQ